MSKYEEQLKEHNKYKLWREVEALKTMEKNIKENMDELYKEIETIIYKTNSKITKWDKEELNKYNRLEKMNEEIEEKVEESKKKEYRIILSFLVAGAIATNGEIDNILKKKKKKMTKSKATEIVKDNWSGLTLLERHKKNALATTLKIKEVVNNSIINEKTNMKKIMKKIKAEVTKSKDVATILADAENTSLNYRIVKEKMKKEKEAMLLYNAILDKKTCDKCASLDGNIYKIGQEPKLPIHPNCRCAYTPIIK